MDGHVPAQLANQQTEPRNNKPESHESETGSDPREKCPLGGKLYAWILHHIRGARVVTIHQRHSTRSAERFKPSRVMCTPTLEG